ncbi:MAG: phenylacetate--CoA ligase family protein [Phycisphaerae bacterium]|nr:phenylacetate--CoA ligase family protein [Phycisphaerae bacterium]
MKPTLSAFLSRCLLDRAGGYRHRVLEGFRERTKANYLPREEIESRQVTRLAALLRHAARHVPAWRERLPAAADILVENARDILLSLPVMRKEDIQARLFDYVADDGRSMWDNATGGSTGTPMTFKIDMERKLAGDASHYWSNSLAGWRYGERIAMLWGSDRDVRDTKTNRRFGLRCLIDNIRWYNAFDMGPDQMAEFHTAMNRFQPHLIVAYAGAIHTFARYLGEKGITPSFPLRSIVSSAEVITSDMREAVERVFRKPVFDRYGSRELGPVAAECGKHRGLHVNETDCLVEIDSRDPFREPGPLIITYLSNFAMPFIRYDTGDWARFESREPCACGRTTLRLAPVIGRESDLIRTASGKLIHGEFFTHLLYGVRGVREFQFVQEDLHTYRLLLLARQDGVAERKSCWRSRILEAVGADASLTIEYVDRIPLTPSGKRKFTISKVQRE